MGGGSERGSAPSGTLTGTLTAAQKVLGRVVLFRAARSSSTLRRLVSLSDFPVGAYAMTKEEELMRGRSQKKLKKVGLKKSWWVRGL